MPPESRTGPGGRAGSKSNVGDGGHGKSTRSTPSAGTIRRRRARFTERLDWALAQLPDLIADPNTAARDWLPERAIYHKLPHQDYWFTADGLRETARRLRALADAGGLQ